MDAEAASMIEQTVPSEAAALAELLTALPERPERIGLEAGPLSEWPVRGLTDAGFQAVPMETRQVRAALEKRVRDAARQDPVCQRLMTMPGLGAVVALAFRAAVDRPERFSSSKAIGARFGLAPRRHQSGETDRSGAISRAGDASVRVALFEAAHVLMTRLTRWSKLKAWAVAVAKRRGARRAKVALARKIGIVLHRMWIDDTDFRFTDKNEVRDPIATVI